VLRILSALGGKIVRFARTFIGTLRPVALRRRPVDSTFRLLVRRHCTFVTGIVLACIIASTSACADQATSAEPANADVSPDIGAVGGDATVDPCGPSDDGAAADLIDFSGWEVLPADRDPWANVRDASAPCIDPFPREEEGTLEFDTKRCTSFAVSSTLLAGLRPGDEVSLVGSHSTLVADEPATGHLEVMIGDQMLFAYETPVPDRAKVVAMLAVMPVCAPAGTEVRIHVRNHGANSWRINRIRRSARTP